MEFMHDVRKKEKIRPQRDKRACWKNILFNTQVRKMKRIWNFFLGESEDSSKSENESKKSRSNNDPEAVTDCAGCFAVADGRGCRECRCKAPDKGDVNSSKKRRGTPPCLGVWCSL